VQRVCRRGGRLACHGAVRGEEPSRTQAVGGLTKGALYRAVQIGLRGPDCDPAAERRTIVPDPPMNEDVGVGALVVMARTAVDTHPLVRGTRLRIGRAPDNDVCIDDPSVSRYHAVLNVGPALSIEDLGSSNGTFLALPPTSRGRAAKTAETDRTRTLMPSRRLASGTPAEVAVGAILHFGEVMALVTDRATAQPAPAETNAVERGGPDADIVVRDPRMLALHDVIARVAATETTVLVLGETGVGKERVAEEVHRLSSRRAGRLLRLNCAAIPEPLIEGELFGHERGAFTGATGAKAGLFECASGGTVFLDEVGELPLATQAKLLRVLEERRVMRLGARDAIPVDVRFVAATNRDLEAEVAGGRFREDLFFRLNVFPLVVPPLRERRGDIEDLLASFVRAICARERRAPEPRLSPAALEWLMAQDWPGNVRELRNAVERALVLCRGETLLPEHFAPVRADRGERAVTPRHAGETIPPSTLSKLGPLGDLQASYREVERERIERALQECAGNQTRAAKLLGITRRVLVKRMEQYGMPRPRKE
jgi:transcriptional regulator with GAF, ATPase, and Fis domain